MKLGQGGGCVQRGQFWEPSIVFGELIAQARAGPNITEQLPALLVSLTTTAMLQLRTQSPRIKKSTTNIKYQPEGEGSKEASNEEIITILLRQKLFIICVNKTAAEGVKNYPRCI